MAALTDERHAPIWLVQIASSLINITMLLFVFLNSSRSCRCSNEKFSPDANRYGPNRVGPFGLFQPIADGIKMLIKEDVVPARADKIVHFWRRSSSPPRPSSLSA